MDYATFTRITAERAGLPEETAKRIEHATLRTLAAQLPAPLQDDLRPPREEAEAFAVDEFVRRVAERGDVGPDEAWTGAAAVLTTVRDAVTPGEFDDVLSQLPQDYRELVGPMA
jgi:uncharacterized protein (DUF2267 family)